MDREVIHRGGDQRAPDAVRPAHGFTEAIPRPNYCLKRLDTKTDSQTERPAGLEPGDVPFLGWSRAAHEFRVKAAAPAPQGFRPLIIGDPGVGKRTMARAWRRVARRGKGEWPIIDLDTWREELPDRCIAVTTKRPPPDRPCFLLESGTWGEHPSARRAPPPCPPTSCSGSRSRCMSRPSTASARSISRPSWTLGPGSPAIPAGCDSGRSTRRSSCKCSSTTTGRPTSRASPGPCAIPAA